MTKEQLLQLVSEAYDDGAYFSIRLHHVSKEEAGEIADQFSEYFDTPCKTDKNGTTGWNKYQTEDWKIDLTTYYEEVPVCAKCQK